MRGLGIGLGWSSQETHPQGVPVSIAAPTVAGSTVQGQLLSCSPGAWSQTFDSFTYQWQRDGVDISAATGQTYVTGSSDHGKAIGCVVIAHNVFGASSSRASSNTIGPIIVTPVNSVAPAITGTTAIGDTLTCSTGTWSDSPTGYTYQWKRDGVAIVGATASTHVVVNADDTHSITCVVTATNLAGSASATSNAVTGGAWTPASLGAALKGWWNASSILDENGLPVADGGTIKTLVDLSGNGNNHANDTSLSSFPRYRASKTDTNFGPNKKAIEYDGSQIILTPAPIVLTQPFTVWAVVRSNTGDRATLGGLGTWAVYTAAAGGFVSFQAGSFWGGSIVTLGAWTIVIARFNHGGASKLRADGADASTQDPGAGAGTGVGIGDYAWGGNPLVGFIADAGVVLGAMSDADIAKLEHYLSVTYGVDSL